MVDRYTDRQTDRYIDRQRSTLCKECHFGHKEKFKQQEKKNMKRGQKYNYQITFPGYF